MTSSELIALIRQFVRQEATEIYARMRQEELENERRNAPSATMTRKEAMAYLGVSSSTLARMVQRRELRPVYVGGAVRFRKKDLDAYLNK
mgnify:CR=1 FL=1